MEKILRQVQKPEVEVESFRQNLRRSLLEKSADSQPGLLRYRIAFAAAGSLCLVLIGIVTLFIAEPSYALQLHDALVAKDRELVPLQGAEDPTISNAAQLAGTKKAGDWDDLVLLSNNQFEVDQNLVRNWASQSLETLQPDLEVIEGLERYTVSRFKLNNGNYVQVYTKLPSETKVRYTTY
jgi:hypothetical protein